MAILYVLETYIVIYPEDLCMYVIIYRLIGNIWHLQSSYRGIYIIYYISVYI